MSRGDDMIKYFKIWRALFRDHLLQDKRWSHLKFEIYFKIWIEMNAPIKACICSICRNSIKIFVVSYSLLFPIAFASLEEFKKIIEYFQQNHFKIDFRWIVTSLLPKWPRKLNPSQLADGQESFSPVSSIWQPSSHMHARYLQNPFRTNTCNLEKEDTNAKYYIKYMMWSERHLCFMRVTKKKIRKLCNFTTECKLHTCMPSPGRTPRSSVKVLGIRCNTIRN